MRAQIDVNRSGYGPIVLDGTDVSTGAAGITLHAKPGHVPTLTVDVVLLDGAGISAEADVVVPAETHDTLVALGWTPPGGGA